MTDQAGPSGDDWAAPANPVGPREQAGFNPGAGGPFPPAGGRTPPPPPVDGWGTRAPGHGGVPPVNPGGVSISAPLSPPIAQTGPPTWILVVGSVVPLACLALLLQDGLAMHVVGWLVAIIGSVGALAAFTAIDLRRRASRSYVDQPGLLAALRVAVLVIGLVVAALLSYKIADAVARWDRWF